MSANELRELSRNTDRPLYQQIKFAIAQNIESGVWQPGEKIPSENQLAAELGVSRMTINRPLRELTSQGMLKRVHGIGTFVAESPRHASLIELKPIAEEIVAAGKTHSATLLELREIKADSRLAERMVVNEGEILFHIVMVHSQDGVPIQLEDRYVNPTTAPNFLDVDFSATTPSQYLLGLFHPAELEHIVQAIMPDAKTAQLLSIPTDEPCLRLCRRTWQKKTVVTAANLIYPSSRYDLGARLNAKNFSN
ncbi:MAG: histidine utilization repressor [Gammaproteobacteria bacterium]|nr:histidine utilization repressor [Gammaproteobacteria bacterium]MDH3378961.1 histidine utilization repressor [Gammaproteobacteria bacterium]